MMKSKKLVRIWRLVAFLLTLVGFYIFGSGRDFSVKVTEKPKQIQVAKPKNNTRSAGSVQLPEVDPGAWELVLVNRDHPIGAIVPELGDVAGVPVDRRIVGATSAFLEEVLRLDANEPLQGLYSGYRSVTEQELLFQTRVAEEMATGLSEEEAVIKVSKTVLPAGASEHHTGLAIDLMRSSEMASDIARVAPDYGFILRYPPGKESITGVNHEDWHFRYVGIESAKYMTEHNLTLEEYLEQLGSR